MAYLFSEILASLIVIAMIAFTLGWVLRGLKEKTRRRPTNTFKEEPDDDFENRV